MNARTRKLLRSDVPIRVRIVLSLCAIATLATLLTLFIPRYQLEADLEKVATQRLEGATRTVRALLEDRQGHLAERHRAMARTPEFRANLETADVATLSVLADSLAAREPLVDAVVFSNSRGDSIATAGDPAIQSVVQAMVLPAPPNGCAGGRALPDCSEIVGPGDPILFSEDGRLVLGTSVPLYTRGRFVGRAAFVEIQAPGVLAEWSRLSGASARLSDVAPAPDRFERLAVAVPPLELRVSSSFATERAALDRLQARVLVGGLFALCIAFLLASPLARSLLLPLRAIEDAAHRIRDGRLTTRLRSDRGDEFGDVARAFDTMLDQIESAQNSLERAQAIGRLGGWSKQVGEPSIQLSRQLLKIVQLEGAGPVWEIETLYERIHPDDRTTFRSLLERCEEGGLTFELDHRLLLADGSERNVHTRGERVRTGDNAYRLEGTLQDVTERKRIEEQVRVLAYQDGLTGLGNRRLFADELQRSISLARQSLQPLAIVFLDLDDFKIVNDTLGHPVGDQLLCVVADRLTELVSELGGLAENPSVHRLGGDEFAILLPKLDDWSSVRGFVEQIGHRLSASVELDGYDVQTSASVGIATWPDQGLDATSLLTSCDTAMYHAKLRGRGQYRFYSPSMKQASERRLRLESRLRNAIEEGEFEVVYQPKVAPATGRVVGLEALLRWNDDDLGPISPDEFVSLAEETGQILALGEWVLGEVARQIRSWVDAGVCDVPVAVNISSSQIEAETLLDTLVGILRESELPPTYLELEVTESALLRNEELAIELLEEVKQAGIRIALDDFGTGYSSLGYLRRLPIDEVKIDRSFVVDVVSDAQARALVGSIVEMAHILELAVVVEGVEDEAQRDLLCAMGCEMIQGYFYSPAVSAAEVPAILESGFSAAPA